MSKKAHLDLEVHYSGNRDARIYLMGEEITRAVQSISMSVDAEEHFATATITFRAYINADNDTFDALKNRQEIVNLRRELSGLEPTDDSRWVQLKKRLVLRMLRV